jgi:hypothetical protein
MSQSEPELVESTELKTAQEVADTQLAALN